MNQGQNVLGSMYSAGHLTQFPFTAPSFAMAHTGKFPVHGSHMPPVLFDYMESFPLGATIAPQHGLYGLSISNMMVYQPVYSDQMPVYPDLDTTFHLNQAGYASAPQGAYDVPAAYFSASEIVPITLSLDQTRHIGAPHGGYSGPSTYSTLTQAMPAIFTDNFGGYPAQLPVSEGLIGARLNGNFIPAEKVE